MADHKNRIYLPKKIETFKSLCDLTKSYPQAEVIDYYQEQLEELFLHRFQLNL